MEVALFKTIIRVEFSLAFTCSLASHSHFSMNSSCQSFAKGTDNPEEKVRKFGEYRPGTGFLEAGVYIGL